MAALLERRSAALGPERRWCWTVWTLSATMCVTGTKSWFINLSLFFFPFSLSPSVCLPLSLFNLERTTCRPSCPVASLLAHVAASTPINYYPSSEGCLRSAFRSEKKILNLSNNWKRLTADVVFWLPSAFHSRTRWLQQSARHSSFKDHLWKEDSASFLIGHFNRAIHQPR